MKTILITGCSTGTALASVKTLQQRGYHVIATTRTKSDAQHLKNQGLEAYQMDMDDSAMIQEVAHTIKQPIEALFLHARYASL